INFRNELREKGVICTDADHPVNYAMMAFVDIMNPGLVVLPTHRLIKDLPDYSKEDVREKLRGDFDIIEDIEVSKLQESLRAEDEGKRFAYYSGGGRFDLLTLKNTEAPKKRMPDKDESYINLDVAVLHSVILEPVFAIDKKNMAQQKNLSYTRSVDEAIKGVDYGKYQCAFIVNPTKVSQIRDVAAAGEKMPQKSTYFHPKLITGLVMNKITD
ncbi:MAG: DUF1015 family protein, partial [Bacillota bacterium]|nr:DUF1015 family protein [Bacillota bacterium]